MEFLDRLRHAKDKAEFDQFMAERRQRPEGPVPQPEPLEGTPSRLRVGERRCPGRFRASLFHVLPTGAGGWGRARLAQGDDRDVHAVAALLHQTGKELPLLDPHAEPVDRHVGHFGLTALIDYGPFDIDRRAARADDLARHERLAAGGGMRRGYAERLAGVMSEAAGISIDHRLLEGRHELLPLFRRRGAGVLAEHELRDPRTIEIRAEELVEDGDPLVERDARSHDLDCLGAKAGDELGWVLLSLGRLGDSRRRKHKHKGGICDETLHLRSLIRTEMLKTTRSG